MRRERHAFCFEFLLRVYSASYLPPNFQTDPGLADHLVSPILWNVAIRTNSANTCSIAVVDGLFILLEDGIPHFVTCRAELKRVRCLQGCMKASPEENPRKKTNHQHVLVRITASALTRGLMGIRHAPS